MRRTLLLILCLAAWCGAARLGFAGGEMKPVEVVSIASYDRLKADLGVIGRLSGNPRMADALENTLKAMTRGKGLAGLDVKRPWGGVVLNEGTPNDPIFEIYWFLPVTDLKQLMETAKGNPKAAGRITRDGDVYQIGTGHSAIYVRQRGNWALITLEGTNAANAPADPLKLLGDLPKKYDVAVRFPIKDISASVGKMVLATLQRAAGALPIPGASDRLHKAAPLITGLFSQLDDLTLGLKIDSAANKGDIDLDIVPRSGTKLARRLAGMRAGKTAFAGMTVLGGDATGIAAGSLSADDIAKVKEKLAAIQKRFSAELKQQDLSGEQVESVTRLSVDVLDVLRKTLDANKIDVGCASRLEPGEATVVVGAAVVDGEKLRKSLKRLVDDLRKAEPELAKLFKVKTETYQGVPVYTLSMPTPVPELTPVFGETLKVVLATATDKVLVGIGCDTDKMLKKVLDGSKAGAGKETPPIRIKLTPGKVATLIAEVASDDDVKLTAAMVGMALEKAGEKNHVTITASPIPQGMHVRIEMEEGLLKAMAAMGQMVIPLGVVPSSEPADPSDG